MLEFLIKAHLNVTHNKMHVEYDPIRTEMVQQAQSQDVKSLVKDPSLFMLQPCQMLKEKPAILLAFIS